MTNLKDVTGNYFPNPDLVIGSDQLRGAKHVNKFGHITCVACANVLEDVWDLGGVYTYPTTGRIHNIVSASSDDTACGIGARTLEIEGLDINYNEIKETVTLDGTCSVATNNEYFRVHRMRVITVGSNLYNVGQITATAQTDGTTSAGILAGETGGNQTHMAIYTVPAGKVGYITQIYHSIGKKQSVKSTIDLVVRDSTLANAAFNTKFTMDGNTTGTTYACHHPSPYLVIPSKSDIKINSTATSAGANLTAGFDIILM